MEDEIESRRPGGVTLAATLLVIAGMLNIVFTLLLQQPLPVKGLLLMIYVGVLGVAVGLFVLKKWAYWAFIGLATLSAMSTAIDLVFIALGIAPTNDTFLIQVVQTVIAVVWVVYFATLPVRRAFEIGETQQDATSGAATPRG